MFTTVWNFQHIYMSWNVHTLIHTLKHEYIHTLIQTLVHTHINIHKLTHTLYVRTLGGAGYSLEALRYVRFIIPVRKIYNILCNDKAWQWSGAILTLSPSSTHIPMPVRVPVHLYISRYSFFLSSFSLSRHPPSSFSLQCFPQSSLPLNLPHFSSQPPSRLPSSHFPSPFTLSFIF